MHKFVYGKFFLTVILKVGACSNARPCCFVRSAQALPADVFYFVAGSSLCYLLLYIIKKGFLFRNPFAVRTGLEPATSGVTGRYSNQLNYRTIVLL